MKLLIAGIYPPDVGGPATYAVLLERELPKHGIEVKVVPFASVRHLPPLVRHVMYGFKLWQELKRADTCLVQDAVSSGLPAVFAAWCAGKPLLVRIGGDYAWEQGTQRFGVTDSIEDFQNKKYGLNVEMLRSIQKFVVGAADVVIAPSKYLGNIVERWLPEGRSVEVVYNGVELPLEVEELTERPEGVLIVSAGRMVPWKGFDELISVVATEPSWHLAIIGDGPDRQRLKELAQRKHCADRVIFPGALPRKDMLGWCKAADVFVLNSSYEGLSHLLIEVQSIGVPTIATSIGGNREVIRDGESGVLVPPHDTVVLHDAIAHMIYDKERARVYGEKAQEFTKDFSIDTTIDALDTLLKKL